VRRREIFCGTEDPWSIFGDGGRPVRSGGIECQAGGYTKRFLDEASSGPSFHGPGVLGPQDVYKRRAFRYNQGMSETDAPPPPKKKGMNCGMWIVLGVLLLVAIGFAVPSFCGVNERARIMQASTNCRQIIIALMTYAGDHDGHYPDTDASNPATSNDAFRPLIQAEWLEDERVFSAPASPFLGDNNIGEDPTFFEALESNENHWCMVKGLTDESDGHLALMFENPAHTYAWPPLWNADKAGQPVVGRAWKSGTILVGRNDGSIMPEKLISPKGLRVPLTDEVNAVLFPPGGSFLPVAK